MSWKIQLSEMNYDEAETAAVNRVIKSEWLTMGHETNNFEIEFTNYIGHENQGVFVSSATAALHLILMSLNLRDNDEVIIPGLTFVSDANVVLQLGAVPVFADSVSTADLNVNVDNIQTLITEKTRAIVIVHFAGFPMNLEKLAKICAERGIKLIEDCAHSPGAMINGNKCGTFGDFSFFSFFSNKNLAIGEGGMAFAKEQEYQKKIKLMRSHGMSALTLDRHEGRASTYDVECVGLNYRADEIRAALGREQLKKLDNGNLKRGEIYKSYCNFLAGSEIEIPFSNFNEDIKPSFHIMPVILPTSVSRYSVIEKMREKRIQTSQHYPNFKSFTQYRDLTKKYEMRIVDCICARELTLPLHPRMSVEDAKIVSEALIASM